MGVVLRCVSNAVRGRLSFADWSGEYRPRVGVALGGGPAVTLAPGRWFGTTLAASSLAANDFRSDASKLP
jgi:hypothetical protein